MFSSARWVSRWGAVLALAVVLTAQVSQAQKKPAPAVKKSATARKPSASKPVARKVVVLDFEGDRKGRVRTQVESALRKVRAVQVVPLKQFTAAAAKERLRGAAAREPGALPVVAPRLALNAGVTGTVGASSVQVRVLDERGREVFSRELPLQKGLIPAAQARTLAEELAAASSARTEPAPEPFAEPTPPAEPEPAPVKPAEPLAQTPAQPATPAPEAPKVEKPAPTTVAEALPPMEPTAAPVVDAESHTVTEPAPEPAAASTPEKAHPPLVRLFLGGSTTWRKYCARPGVAACRDFDARPEEEQLGDTVDFDTSVPYLGVGLEVELLPLARSDSFLRGLGLVVGVQRGYSETSVQITSPSGETPSREVVATDTTLSALAMYRYYFGRGGGERPLLGYAGLRGGIIGRAFDVDESAASPLAGTHRLYPVVGLEVSVPLVRAVRIEGAGHFYFNPTPGQWIQDESDLDLELRDLGASVSSSGWSAELGLAGDLWGPLGYSVRFRLMHFNDTFSGQGVRTGWGQGGVAEETYSGLQWGLTAAW